jgi:hypothetical protein
MVMKKMILLVICLLAYFSCEIFDENLTLEKKEYTGNELRIDGYYYFLSEDTDITALCFLYRNGVVITSGGFIPHDLEEIEKKIINRTFETKDNWGVFNIDNNNIQLERWIGSTGIKACLSKSTGYIKNDTTIHFTEIYYSETKKTHSVDQIWHFKSFSNKPDSTNNYIK